MEVTIRILDEGGICTYKINEEEKSGNRKNSVVNSYLFDPGQEIKVVARDVSNNVKEEAFIIKSAVVSSPAVNANPTVNVNATHKHRYYALLMCVEKYDDPAIPTLAEPTKDAKLLKNVLTKRYTFEEQDVTLLENPTLDAIGIALDDLSRKATPDDFVLIFFAGHGNFDQKKDAGYWYPSDARLDKSLRLFRISALVEDIRAIQAKHTLLIADACFSGGIFATREVRNNADFQLADMMKRQSRKAMTSGSLGPVPDKSVFMKYLLQILAENNDKYFSSESLFEQLRPIVKNNTETIPRYGEIRNTGDEDGTFVFMLKEN